MNFNHISTAYLAFLDLVVALVFIELKCSRTTLKNYYRLKIRQIKGLTKQDQTIPNVEVICPN